MWWKITHVHKRFVSLRISLYISDIIFPGGGSSAPSIKSSWLQLKTQYLVIQLNGRLIQGQVYQLRTEFTGELADDLAGFYRSEYEEDGVRK